MLLATSSNRRGRAVFAVAGSAMARVGCLHGCQVFRLKLSCRCRVHPGEGESVVLTAQPVPSRRGRRPGCEGVDLNTGPPSSSRGRRVNAGCILVRAGPSSSRRGRYLRSGTINPARGRRLDRASIGTSPQCRGCGFEAGPPFRGRCRYSRGGVVILETASLCLRQRRCLETGLLLLRRGPRV
jgi:hypothetical protein